MTAYSHVMGQQGAAQAAGERQSAAPCLVAACVHQCIATIHSGNPPGLLAKAAGITTSQTAFAL